MAGSPGVSIDRKNKLEAAEAAEERARAPVNFPKNYAFSKNGTHLYAHTVAGWHGTKPENATISGDKENFYNTIAQALTADNKPDPNGCGRVKLLDWIRKRRPDLLPVARLIMGTPSFIRLVKAEGALRLPSADGDDLDFSAADWDPLSIECPDYNDPNYAKTQVRLRGHPGTCAVHHPQRLLPPRHLPRSS